MTDPFGILTGNYVPKVRRVAQNIGRGRVVHVTVEHDADCAQLAGTGPCDCDPDVYVEQTGPRGN